MKRSPVKHKFIEIRKDKFEAEDACKVLGQVFIDEESELQLHNIHYEDLEDDDENLTPEELKNRYIHLKMKYKFSKRKTDEL
jgi:hypothetical protein